MTTRLYHVFDTLETGIKQSILLYLLLAVNDLVLAIPLVQYVSCELLKVENPQFYEIIKGLHLTELITNTHPQLAATFLESYIRI